MTLVDRVNLTYTRVRKYSKTIVAGLGGLASIVTLAISFTTPDTALANVLHWLDLTGIPVATVAFVFAISNKTQQQVDRVAALIDGADEGDLTLDKVKDGLAAAQELVTDARAGFVAPPAEIDQVAATGSGR